MTFDEVCAIAFARPGADQPGSIRRSTPSLST